MERVVRFGKHQKAADILEKAKQELEALGYEPDMVRQIAYTDGNPDDNRYFKAILTVDKSDYGSFSPEVSEDALS